MVKTNKNKYYLNIASIKGVSMRKEFNVIIEQDSDGWYVGTVPELRGCHTQAKTLDSLTKRIQEAKELCLEI